ERRAVRAPRRPLGGRSAHRRFADRVRAVDVPVSGDAREPLPPARRRGGDGPQRARDPDRRQRAARAGRRRHLLHPAQHPAPHHGHLRRRGSRHPVGIRRSGKHRRGGLRLASRRQGGGMNDVRTDPLTPKEIASFNERGFLFPVRVLDDAQVEELRVALDDHLEGRRQSQQYELTDPIVESGQATAASGAATSVAETTEVEKKPHSVPFLFNLWERDKRFWKIDSNPVIAGMARQLLGSEEVVLMEDGAVIKKPVVGGKLSWHQDYAYWPLATPAAVTCWIALDDVGGENGGMQVAAGSHLLGEKLPVEFGDGSSFMHDERPGIGEVRTPEEEGL